MVPNYRHYLIFLFSSLALSIGLQILLPFPYGLGLALAIFIALPLAARKVIRSSGAGRFGGVEYGSRFVKSCLVCGKHEKGRQCSRCGSRQFGVK